VAAKTLKEWRRICTDKQKKYTAMFLKLKNAQESWHEVLRLEKEIAKLDTEHRRDKLELARKRLSKVLSRVSE
jgi:hypothetical protein